MNREEFIKILNERIKDNPDHNDIISYYFELISDKMDLGMTEEEAVESLGSIDDIIKNIDENKADDIEFKSLDENNDKKTEDIIVEKIENNKEEANKETQTVEENNSQLSGGKMFVLVLWKIATVLFCIASVVIFVLSIIALAAGVGVLAYGFAQFTEVISFGFLSVGVGLFVIGISLVSIFYANQIRKMMFGNRLAWNENIRRKLAGE